MVFVTPDILWDVGFQLSLAATMGLVLLSEPLTNWFIGIAEKYIQTEKLKNISAVVSEYFLMTIAAQITTFPLILFYFERFSFTSLPANSAILPAQPPIMLLGGLSVLAGLIWKPLGQLIAYFVWPFLTYTIRVVEWFASRFRNTIIINDFKFIYVIIILASIFSIIFWRDRVVEIFRKFKVGWVIIFILVLNLFIWNGIANAPDGNLHINVLDVGSGSGVLIQTPEGRYVLINGGKSSSKVSDGVGRILPLFQQKIDSLIISSCAADEIEGLTYAVEGFLPETVLWTCNRSENRTSRYLDEELSELNVKDLELRTGDIIDLGQGAIIEVVAISDEGAYLMVSMDSFRMLIVDNVGIDDYSSNQVNVMLAGQGESEVISENLLSTANPQLIILSLGAGDKQNRPDVEVIGLFDGYSLLRTDDAGWIKVSTDGESMWVDIEKK